MTKAKAKSQPKLIKATHPSRPKTKYFLVDPGANVVKKLLQPLILKTCERPCTAVVSLLPRLSVPGHVGFGFPMVNVNGFRWINAFVISDPLNSTAQRGFSLELSFALEAFVPGFGVKGESSFFFDFSANFDPSSFSHRTIRCGTSDLTSAGGLPRIGGVDLAHILRVPVLGPFVRASVFNEDDTTRSAEVKAYLSS